MSPKHPVQARVTHRFAAPAERVFDAWLDPAAIARWMFGAALRDEEVVGVDVDARVGGAFSFRVRRQGQLVDHVGRYLEIERPRRLVFTWGVAPNPSDASRVSVEIVPLGDGCELRLVHDIPPEWADFAERTAQGWTQIVASLARSLV